MKGQEMIVHLSYQPNLYAYSPIRTIKEEKEQKPKQPKPKFYTSPTLKRPIDP